MDASQISIGIAFLAGLASFLSPCVLSLVPAYVSYLSGRATLPGGTNKVSQWDSFTHGMAFVIGFSFVFILLGAAASFLGGLLYNLTNWVARIGGVVVILLGLHMTGIIRFPFLMYDTRNQTLPNQKWGYLSSVLMGVFFSAGWSPCVGPVLGAILTLSITSNSVFLGTILLTAYSAGLAIPFLIAAIGIGWVTTILKRYGKSLHYLEIFMGVILIILGIMLMLNILPYLSRYGSIFNFGI